MWAKSVSPSLCQSQLLAQVLLQFWCPAVWAQVCCCPHQSRSHLRGNPFFGHHLKPRPFFLVPGTVLSTDMVHHRSNVLPLTAFILYFSLCCCGHQTICLFSPPLHWQALRPCFFFFFDSAVKNPLTELIYMHKHSQGSLHSPFLVEYGCVCVWAGYEAKRMCSAGVAET